MSLTPDIIIRQAYARIGAFDGTASDIATAYTGSLTTVNTESFPLQSMYDMLTGVESEMALAVAMNEDNVLRSLLQDTVTVNTGNVISSVGAGGGTIIGVWGQVRDAATGTELTPLHEDEIRSINSAPSGVLQTDYFSYAYHPPRIYATVAQVAIDVCTFNYVTRAAAISANGALLFQTCQNYYFYGLMANLKNEDPAYTALANEYLPLYQQWIQSQNPPRNLTQEAAA